MMHAQGTGRGQATRWAAVVVMLFLVGCSQLEVRVAVLDPGVVAPAEDERLLKVVLPRVIAQTDLDINTIVDGLANQHASFYIKLSEDLVEQAKNLPEGQAKPLQKTAEALQDGFGEQKGQAYEKLKAELKQNRNAIRELNEQMLAAGNESRDGDRRQLIRELQYRYALTQSLRRLFIEDANEEIQKLRQQTGTMSDETAVKIDLLASRSVALTRASTGRAIRSLIEYGHLLDSPHAHAVASAPEKAWAPTYNRAFGGGWLGNVNVAIKRAQQGSFTVKGLTFDPSDVARAAAKITTQAVLLSAQLSGVPVRTTSTPAAGTSGAALAQSSSRLAQLEQEQERASVAVRTHQKAMQSVAMSILAEYERLADAASRKQAIAAITATYESHKDLIQITK